MVKYDKNHGRLWIMYQPAKENLVYRILELGRDEELLLIESGNYNEANKIFMARNRLLCALLDGVNHMYGEIDRMLFPMLNSGLTPCSGTVRDLLLKFRDKLIWY